MNTNEEIEKLNNLEKRLYFSAAVKSAVAIGGYYYNSDLIFYAGTAFVLIDCIKGISLNNLRDQLRKNQNNDRYGGQR